MGHCSDNPSKSKYHNLCWLLWTWYRIVKKHQASNSVCHHSQHNSSSLHISAPYLQQCVKHARAVHCSGTVHHNRDRETLFPLYIPLKIHAVTCKRNIIEHSSIWGFVFLMTVSCSWHLTYSMGSANALWWMMLCVHQRCAVDFSRQQQLTTLTAILVLQQQRVHFMAVAFHICSILISSVCRTWPWCVGHQPNHFLH